MQDIYILKIGGSIATYKSTDKLRLRRKLLQNIAGELALWQKKNQNIHLILIHGAGGAGHSIAHKYNLRDGTNAHKQGKKGAVLSRLTNQKLDTEILQILIDAGLLVTPTHSASIITSKNADIASCNKSIISHALRQSYIPLFYGEMVFDEKIGMSVCSGDTIAAYIAKHFPVTKIFFATDVDGIYTDDPHINKDATLLTDIILSELEKNDITLTSSHNTDVTDGLRGKINSFKKIFSESKLKEVHIFNGLEAKNIRKALGNKVFPHTTITK